MGAVGAGDTVIVDGEAGRVVVNPTAARLAEEAQQAQVQVETERQIVDTLKRRSDIISANVGIYGVNQGGWIAAIAARKWKDISFVILLEGPAVSLEETVNRADKSLLAAKTAGRNRLHVWDPSMTPER